MTVLACARVMRPAIRLPTMPSIVAKLAERDALSAEMASAATLHQIEINRRTIEAEIQEEIADWCGS